MVVVVQNIIKKEIAEKRATKLKEKQLASKGRKMQKVLNKGEIWFLHNEIGEPTEYEIVDSGIYLTNYGTWEACILFINKENSTCRLPLEILQGLMVGGQMFRKDGEKIAEKLRAAIKEKNLEN